jgi:lipocalin
MFGIFILLSLTVFVSGNILPDTINELNISSYIGHWFQVYGAPTNNIFQGYGTCITADYGLLDDGYISVLNSQLNKNKELEQINGYAYYKNSSEPGQLTVHLDGVPVDAPYWIIKLGDIVNNQYQYAIITSPSGISLWVLTRDLDSFKQFYEEEVEDFLNDNNFKYIPIKQTDCQDKNTDLYVNNRLRRNY